MLSLHRIKVRIPFWKNIFKDICPNFATEKINTAKALYLKKHFFFFKSV